ncbi:DNRLRE domain-containing protein [Streptomyces ipomoeae]|uniref:RHS repeat-associated core domain protein n=1 Tax=Streptomyces ipomoeae 91-03 TaxID=698759 RepID=L1KLG5_9ACTN|nr:DNRLRE domain-containing protein [Streptomyces ipomoeae]EKX61228.1 RHS repeat-associated core domain protein [Streptomyces ipomoeae 91-03]MDX2696991.1 DNRLRE domain-containing protein [Streptomyces ipomoeae]MDX2841494.1 DNRLRE domain-containing protein [Streptomyces ipomoeae]
MKPRISLARQRKRPRQGAGLRSLAGGLALATAISLVNATSNAVAAPPEVPEAPKKKAAAPQAADIASAKVAARLSGKRVEALSERTETSTTWVNKDGSLTTELSAGPVRFERDGKWVDVDVKLRESGGGVEPVAHPNGLALAGKTGTPAKSLEAAQDAKAVDLVTLGEGDEQITLQWKGGLPAPKVKGTRAEYVNAVPGADVVVEATRTGFEQYVEIKEKPSTDGFSYTLPLQAEGLKVKQLKDGSVLFTSGKKNKKRAVMPAPVMWDSTVDERSGEHTRRVPVKMKVVKKKGGAVDLLVTPDAKFLADPKTQYPVTVDPSTSSLSNVFDTYVQQGETVDWSSDTELDLGNPGTVNADGSPRYARSFITWDTTPVRDALVSDAKLSLYNFHSGNTDCAAAPWTVWATGAASTSSRWTAQPEWIQQYAESTETAGRDACGGDGWINANVTTLVQDWASAKNTRSHMGLRSISAAQAQWKQVNSANAATNPPKLTVTYNFRPKTGTNREAGPPFFSYGGDYVVNTTTPTLRDTFVDVNGDTVLGAFQVADFTSGSQVGDILTSDFVASGLPASVKVPSGLLTNGKTYKFRTSPYDGVHYNLDWSAWKTFTVDTSAPSAPAKIVSSDYPSGQWVKGEGEAGTFTVTLPSGSDHQWLEWSLDDGATWTKVTTDGAAADKDISVTPPQNGTHTLQVRSVDKADNKSEPLEYTFHAGPGGFITPTEGEYTARRLQLAVETDGQKYDSVSFFWRRSAADDWAEIPKAHVTSGGDPLAAWPVPLTNGKNSALVWKATDTVDPDGTIQIKADFTGPGSASGSSEPLTVVVDRDAEGAATDQVGPGELNLLTGDYTLSATDASAFGLSVTRSASSRVPDQAAQQEGQAPIFGKEWASGTVAEATDSAYNHLRKVTDTAVDVVTAQGDAIHFTANAAQDGWIPEPGSESLTLIGAFSGTFTLTDTEGTSTKFVKPDPQATTWQVATTKVDGVSQSTNTVVSETVEVDGKQLARPTLVIAPTSAVSAATCGETPATKGCRVLQYIYATTTTATGTQSDAEFGYFAGQVQEIRVWATEPGAAVATPTTVATYRYDSQGRLRQAWDPRVGQQTETQYAYHEGRITWLQPSGQLPYTFTYGSAGDSAAAGEGMLLKMARSGLKQGTADTEEGTATSYVVYDVPLTGDKAPYAMGNSDVAAWGQADAPMDATALFPTDSAPSSHSGSGLAAADYRRAGVHYLGVSGERTNTAAPGGHITATEYDRFGNTVRELSASNRILALGKTDEDKAELAELGISHLDSAERAELLSTRWLFNESGTRQTEEFGPIHRATLTEDFKDGDTVLVEAGTSVPARSWTVKEYDEGRPTDGSASVKNQVTLEITGARIRDYYSIMAEKRVIETQYDWAKGLPTLHIQDSGGLNLTTSTDYDAQGRVVSQVLPDGTGNDAATRITEYWKADGTGSCEGRPEWAGLVCWTGPAGAITGGGSNPSELRDTTYEYGYYGQVTKATDTANGAARTTTTSYDAAGRPKTVTTTDGIGKAVPATTTEYDPATGQVTKISSSAGEITKAYDKLGRLISYKDAEGGTTTYEYDLFNRLVKVSDSVPSTVTYTYDHSAEPRGLAVKVTDSVAGAMTGTYDANGSLSSQKLPGGYTLTQSENPDGEITNRTYTRDSDGTLVYSDTVSESVHGQVVTHAGWSDQTYAYDDAGRLTSVEDTVGTVCTRRDYTFDKRSNRTSLSTAVGTPGAACSTSGATTANHSYDSADRLVDSGYAYDEFGRTTTEPGSTLDYYTNDLVHRQTTGSTRQTWQLDPAQRFSSWTVESGDGSTWTQTASKVNHYGGDDDNPRWIVEDTATGAVSRNVSSLTGDLAATTSATGDVTLQFTTIHGDVALLLPLDTSVAPTALDADEYGNPRAGQSTERYGWLGAKQRSAETAGGDAVLMGVRMYTPSTGRFLQTDPVYGGSATAYDYANQDPGNQYDLSGQASWVRKCSRGWTWSGYRFECKFYFTRQKTKIIKEDISTMGGAGVAIAEAYACSQIPYAVAKVGCTLLAWSYTWWSVHHVNSAVERGGCFVFTVGANVGLGITWYAYPGNVSKKNKNCKKK